MFLREAMVRLMNERDQISASLISPINESRSVAVLKATTFTSVSSSGLTKRVILVIIPVMPSAS